MNTMRHVPVLCGVWVICMYMYVCQIQDEAATDVEFTENADNPYMSHGYTG